MPVVTEMPKREQDMSDESPALRKFGQAMGASRFTRMMAVYILLDELEDAPKERHDEIYRAFGEKGGTSIDALKVDMGWARKINERDLRTAFRMEGILDTEWTERIGLGHLRTIAKAQRADGAPMDSEDRVAWLLGAYHANEGAGAFEDRLRAGGYLPVKKQKRFGAEEGAKEAEQILKGREAAAYLARCLAGEYGSHVQAQVGKSWARRAEALPEKPPAPATVCTLLGALAEDLHRQSVDLSLGTGVLPGSYRAAKTLRKLADRLDQGYPGAEFVIGEIATPPPK